MRSSALLLLFLVAPLLPSAPAPALKPSGAVVLDNCDPKYDGKPAYEDNITFLTPDGKLRKRVTGLNVCEEIGSPHRIAIDPARKCLWVAETVSHALLKYSLDGRKVVAVPLKSNAVAIDPGTGNVWAACRRSGSGRDLTAIYSPEGKLLLTVPVPGYDITYSPRDRAFWVAGKELIKLSLAAKVLVRKPVAAYSLISVAACPRTGNLWASERSATPRIGRDRIILFGPDGGELKSIPTGERPAVRLAVCPRDGSLWAARGLNVKLERYNSRGTLEAAFPLEVLSVDVDHATGGVWAVTEQETLLLSRDGKVMARARHPGRTTQAWVASY